MTPLDFFYLPAALLTAPWWARKARGGWKQRFGHTPALPPSSGRRLLIHAVSVGEVNTLRGLIPLLRDRAVEVIVATTTDTGVARAQALFQTPPLASAEPGRPAVRVVRYPLDASWSVRRFLDSIAPDAAVLVELEIWPNFLGACQKRRIPVAVINGRLSARSFRGYSQFRRFLRPSFARLKFAAVQDSDYAARFTHMGAADVRITGSMKWDAVETSRSGDPPPPEALRLAELLGIDRTRPLIVAGSTGPGATASDPSEEQLFDRACPPGVQLLCAPRKPERFDDAFAALGGPARCRRRTNPLPQDHSPRSRFLLDSIGELRLAYALADVVIVGRTFTNLRGSDPIEPISLAKPTVIGPDFANFDSIVSAFRETQAIEITNADGLPGVLTRLLANREQSAALVQRGLACIERHKGATARHADLICRELLSPRT